MEWMSYRAKNYDSNGRVNRNKECKKIISEVENSETVAANFLPQKGKFLCEKE